jgi:hypothetical protein
MPAGWIEKLKGEGIKHWAYDKLMAGDVVFVSDRGKQGYPKVAEIQLTDEDVSRFAGLEHGVTIIMRHKDNSQAIDDPQSEYSFDEIVFYLECVK